MNLRSLEALLLMATVLSPIAAQEPYTLQTLDNGARIVTVSESRSPLVTVATLEGGSHAAPPWGR